MTNSQLTLINSKLTRSLQLEKMKSPMKIDEKLLVAETDLLHDTIIYLSSLMDWSALVRHSGAVVE